MNTLYSLRIKYTGRKWVTCVALTTIIERELVYDTRYVIYLAGLTLKGFIAIIICIEFNK